jgi:proteasome lid subunit RPN8/RPN11
MKLSAPVLAAVVGHACDARPRECCGVLIGNGTDIVEALRTRNIDESPDRFLIDPRDHFHAVRRARECGLEVLGFYHSHPHSPPYPSPTDLEDVTYPNALCLIVGLAGPEPEARLFRLGQDGVCELLLEVAEAVDRTGVHLHGC